MTTMQQTRPSASSTGQTPCQSDPEMWFSSDPYDQWEAQQGCLTCPIVFECRTFGADEIYGVWGAEVKGNRWKAPVQPFMIACKGCGKEIVVKSRAFKYCDAPSCKATSKNSGPYKPRKQKETSCGWGECGKSFMPVRRTQVFCSRACGDKAKRARHTGDGQPMGATG